MTSEDYPYGQPGGGPGIPGTFHFTSEMANVVEYRYYPLDGGPEQRVAAGPDGSASAVLTPVRAGIHSLLVLAVNADGLVSGEGDYTFRVAGE